MFPNEGYFYVKSQKSGLYVSVDGEEKVMSNSTNKKTVAD